MSRNAEQESLFGVSCVQYSYVYSLQGDVVGLLDSTGALVVEYRYDAWGKPISTTGSLASTLGKLNPFRYRGYVFDEESGLYYLRSRYYNPIWNRFINADTIISIYKSNLYVYCHNNTITFIDINGQYAIAVISYDWDMPANYFGHTETAIIYDDVVYFFSYGRYGSEADALDFTGRGILVEYSYNMRKTNMTANDVLRTHHDRYHSEREATVFILESDYDRNEKALYYYINKMVKYSNEAQNIDCEGYDIAIEVEPYIFVFSNCTTVSGEALLAAYGDDIEFSVLDIIPHYFAQTIDKSPLVVASYKIPPVNK